MLQNRRLWEGHPHLPPGQPCPSEMGSSKQQAHFDTFLFKSKQPKQQNKQMSASEGDPWWIWSPSLFPSLEAQIKPPLRPCRVAEVDVNSNCGGFPVINASIFLEICALPALWPAHADQTMSEVTLPLFKDLARGEGPPLSDVPGGPSGTELVGDLLTPLASCPALGGHQQITSWAPISSSIKGTITSAGRLL